MTLEEFKIKRATLRCRKCSFLGLDEHRPGNGNHVGARCPNCGCKDPVEAGMWWFSQDGSKDHIRRTKQNAREVWMRCGDHCSFCGKSWTLCERLKIGRTAQHVYPVMFGGREEGLTIPFCARCQEMSRAMLLETRDVMNALQELDIKPKGIFQ